MATIWIVRWEHNWGSRHPRSFQDYYFTQEPTRRQAIAFLDAKGLPVKRWESPMSIVARPIETAAPDLIAGDADLIDGGK